MKVRTHWEHCVCRVHSTFASQKYFYYFPLVDEDCYRQEVEFIKSDAVRVLLLQ